MKKNVPVILRSVILMTAFFLQLFSAAAQKRKAMVTQEMISQINNIVKPLKEQSDKLLQADVTGTFKAYQQEIKKMSDLKNSAEKSMVAAKIRSKYASFFKDTWSAMKVDEKSYQMQIRQVFPASLSEKILFQPFLNFIITSSSSSYTPPPPAPAPVPENKCVDICSIAAGEINGSAAMISGGAGSYGNCFLRASGWGAAAGKNELYGFLRNNISIPGTFPSDSRKLRVKKSFELKQEATSFAVLGFGYAETWIETYQSDEYMFVMSPVIFGASKTLAKSVNEEYVIEKTQVTKSVCKAYAGTMAYFISGNWCVSELNNIRWSMCEEK